MEAASPCICGRLSTEFDEASVTDPAEIAEWQLQIECDICHVWYHARCVKLGKVTVKTIDKYHCPTCESMCGPSIIRPRTNNHRHNPTEEDASGKPTQVNSDRQFDFTEKYLIPCEFQVGTQVFIEQLLRRTFPDATTLGGVVDTVESGKELTLPYLSTSGFSRPILIPEAEGLGLSTPDEDFTLQDVPSSVGKRFHEKKL